MKIKIIYCEVPHGAHIFATPEPISSEIVDVKTWKELDIYIIKKKDAYGSNYKKSKDEFMGYRYTSNQGGVKIEFYKKPKDPVIKKI